MIIRRLRVRIPSGLVNLIMFISQQHYFRCNRVVKCLSGIDFKFIFSNLRVWLIGVNSTNGIDMTYFCEKVALWKSYLPLDFISLNCCYQNVLLPINILCWLNFNIIHKDIICDTTQQSYKLEKTNFKQPSGLMDKASDFGCCLFK